MALDGAKKTKKTERHADHPRSILAFRKTRLETRLDTRLMTRLETCLETHLETRREKTSRDASGEKQGWTLDDKHDALFSFLRAIQGHHPKIPKCQG